MGPDINDFVITLAVGNNTLTVLRFNLGQRLAGDLDGFTLGLRHDHVDDADGEPGQGGRFESKILNGIEGFDCFVMTGDFVAVADEFLESLFRHGGIVEAHGIGPNFIKEHAPHCCGDNRLVLVPVFGLGLIVRILETDAGVHLYGAFIEGGVNFLSVTEDRQMHNVIGCLGLPGAQALLLGIHREIVATQGNVLRRRCNGLPTGGRKDVVRRQHDQLAFHLSFDGQRHVYGHLVTVEVGVVGRTNKRMDPNGFAFDQHRLERLDGEAVQGGRAVEHHGMAASDFFENIPNLILFAFDHFLSAAHCVHDTHGFEAADNEGLEEHQRHLLGQAALVHAQTRADDNDGAPRVVHALAQQVLAEATLLTLEHIAQRFERAVARTGHRAAMATVIKQGVHCFLQHALLVADNYVRRLELQQVFQAVVPVDHPTIQIVEIASGETSPFKWHERTEVRGNDRQHLQNHPFRTRMAGAEGVNNLHPLGQLFAGRLAAGVLHFSLEMVQLIS